MKPHTTSHTLLNRLSQALLFGVGLVALNSTFVLAQGTTPPSPFADGIYLYGQSPQPQKIGQEYIVFKVEQGKVRGAFYMPQSEFSCFSGTFNAQQMQVAINDPYENSTYKHTIALASPSPVASEGKLQRASLEGYYPISAISNNDQRILQTCLNKSN